MRRLVAQLREAIRNALTQDTEAQRSCLFGGYWFDPLYSSNFRRWGKSPHFIELVQTLYTHAFVTSKNEYHDENLLCKAKGFHNQQGFNLPAESQLTTWWNHYSHRGIMAPSHGASVSLIAAQTAGLLMSRFGLNNPFGWAMTGSEYSNTGAPLQPNARVLFVLDYLPRGPGDSAKFATSLWGAANIQKLPHHCPRSASFFTDILESAVKRCLLPEGWKRNMTDTDIVLTLGKNIVEVEDITPQKLLVWAHVLHQISCGFAENMKSKLYAHCVYKEDEWAMLSIKYLIMLWIGFLQSNLVRIGQGHHADYTDGSDDDGKIGVIFRNKLEVLGGTHNGATILDLGDNYVQDISKVVGRKVYEWSTIKNSLDNTYSPSVHFAIGRPVESFSNYFADKVPAKVPANMSFEYIVENLICPVAVVVRPTRPVAADTTSTTNTPGTTDTVTTDATGTTAAAPGTTDTTATPGTTDTTDTTDMADTATTATGTTTNTTATPSDTSVGSGYGFDGAMDDDLSTISSRSRTLSDVYCDSDERSSLNDARYMSDKNGNVYKLVPELTNRNVKIYSRKAERMPARERGGADKGIDGISMISLSSGTCVTISDCNDEFCAVIWQCTTAESTYKLYEDFEKLELRLWGKYYPTEEHPFRDHLPTEFHDRVIRKLLIVTTLPDQETKSAMLHPKQSQWYLKQAHAHLPYKLMGLTLTARNHPRLSNDCTVDHMFFTADQSDCCATKLNLMKRGHELATWQDEMSAVIGAAPPNPVHDVKSIAEFSRQSKRTKTDKQQTGKQQTQQTIGFIFEGYVLGIINGLMPEYVVQKAIDRPC